MLKLIGYVSVEKYLPKMLATGRFFSSADLFSDTEKTSLDDLPDLYATPRSEGMPIWYTTML